MKKDWSPSYYCLIFMLLYLNPAFGQDKIDKYLVIKDIHNLFISNNYTIKKVFVDYGQADNVILFKDSSIIRNIEKVKNFKSEASILNYMFLLKWSLVNSYSVAGDATFIFKKSFLQNEFTPQALAGQ